MSLANAVQTVARELIGRFPGPDAPPRRELEGIATLAVVIEAERQTIRAQGCSIEKANLFAQLSRQLRADMDELGDAAAGTMAADALEHADALSAATLALMPVAGSA
jgi:hypothetical protein